MSVAQHVALGLAIGAAGCAPISSTTSTLETVVSTDTVVTEPQSSFMTAKVDVTEAGGSVHVTQSGSCEEKRVETVQVRKKITKKAKRSVLIFEIAAATLGIGAGVGIVVDSENVAEEDDPRQTNPVSPDQAKQIGFAVLGLGVLAAAVVSLDLVRAKDKTVDGGTIKRDVEGESKFITCNESAVSNEDVGLVVRGQYMPAGKLDGSGNLKFGWDVVADDVIGSADWPQQATVAVGPGDEIRSIVEGGGKLTSQAVGQVSLEHARAALAENAWQAAMQADTMQAFKDYSARFPEAHADDVVIEIEKRDVVAIKRQKDAQLAAMWTLYEQHIVEGSLLQAGATLKDISEFAPDDPRIEEARGNLLESKLTRADDLVSQARKLIRAKEYVEAMALLSKAEEFVPDHPGVQKYMSRARGKEVKRLLKEAKSLTRSGEYAAASELIERAAVLDPDAKGVERARKAVEKRAGAAAASRAREVARKRAEEEELTVKEAKRIAQAEVRKRAKAEREMARAVRKAEKERDRRARKAAKAAAAAERKEKSLERKRGKHTLVFEVDDDYADENLTSRMRWPQECTAKPRTKRVSKERAGASLHLIRTVDVKCGDFGFHVTKDKTSITIKCENRTCGECTETVEWIVEPAAAQMRRDGKKLKKVKSCR